MKERALQGVLAVVGVVCLFAFAPLFWPEDLIKKLLTFFYGPVGGNVYWAYLYRLACAAFGLIGIFFLMLARNPSRHKPMLGLAVGGLLLLGALVVVFGPPALTPALAGHLWNVIDATFCFTCAVLILVFWPRASRPTDRPTERKPF